MPSCIYLLTNLVNQKQYVGFSTDYQKRMCQYESGIDEHRHLTDSIRKHGWASFTSEIIYMSEDANHCKNEAEVALIASYNTFIGRGYNYTVGGDGVVGYKFTKDDKSKLSAALKGLNKSQSHKDNLRDSLLGVKHTEERKLNISKSLTGRKLTQSQKDNISAGNMGRIQTQECKDKISAGNKGKIRTAEQRRNISLASMGRKHSDKTKLKMKKSSLKNASKRTFPLPDKDEYRQMEKHLSNKELAKCYSVSGSTIKKWKRKLLV